MYWRRTAEVRAVGEAGGGHSVGPDNVHDAVVDEEHLVADGAFTDDEVAGLEQLVAQVRQDGHDEDRVGVREERNGRDQRPTVVPNHLLPNENQRVSVGF